MTCGFLYLCSGYYRYDQGYTPTWPGRETSPGTVVHPQHWPEDLDITGQRVVVIGSGATAVTLVPALAEAAARVTMLQRSPSFVMPIPARDPIAALLRKVLPERQAYAAVRWKNARLATAIYVCAASTPTRRERCCATESASACRPATTWTRTSPRPTSPGTSACAWYPTGTSSRPSGPARPTS